MEGEGAEGGVKGGRRGDGEECKEAALHVVTYTSAAHTPHQAPYIESKSSSTRTEQVGLQALQTHMLCCAVLCHLGLFTTTS